MTTDRRGRERQVNASVAVATALALAASGAVVLHEMTPEPAVAPTEPVQASSLRSSPLAAAGMRPAPNRPARRVVVVRSSRAS